MLLLSFFRVPPLAMPRLTGGVLGRATRAEVKSGGAQKIEPPAGHALVGGFAFGRSWGGQLLQRVGGIG
jgi:hypothetical protein